MLLNMKEIDHGETDRIFRETQDLMKNTPRCFNHGAMVDGGETTSLGHLMSMVDVS
jgi:hypothetical protein